MDYTTLAAVKADLGITETDRDPAIERAIAAASREIDQWSGTEFGVTASATPRVFDASPDGWVAVDRFTDTTGLVVNIGARGTYSTTLAGTDYILRPNNAPARGLAYDTILIPSQPVCYGDGWPGVRVTAKWGFSTVPAPIEEAARLRAIALYHRREAPHGVVGFADETLDTQRALSSDSDIKRLLAPYTDPGIA